MKRSMTRILTTHTGSLPRSPNLVSLLIEEQAGHDTARISLDAAIQHAVAQAVYQQAARGLDVINDGEQGGVDYTVYYWGSTMGPHHTDVPLKDIGELRFVEVRVCAEY